MDWVRENWRALVGSTMSVAMATYIVYKCA